MANICFVCSKRPQFGRNVSHAKNRTSKIFYPNTHKMRFTMKGKTAVKRAAVCTKCVKAGKVEKVI